jgi:hypothetical protein
MVGTAELEGGLKAEKEKENEGESLIGFIVTYHCICNHN